MNQLVKKFASSSSWVTLLEPSFDFSIIEKGSDEEDKSKGKGKEKIWE